MMMQDVEGKAGELKLYDGARDELSYFLFAFLCSNSPHHLDQNGISKVSGTELA